jgi:hypothetical protein
VSSERGRFDPLHAGLLLLVSFMVRVMTPDCDDRFLQNVGKQLEKYMTSQSRESQS